MFQFDPIIAIHEVFQEHGDLSTITNSNGYTQLLEKAVKVVQLVCDDVKQMNAKYVFICFRNKSTEPTAPFFTIIIQ